MAARKSMTVIDGGKGAGGGDGGAPAGDAAWKDLLTYNRDHSKIEGSLHNVLLILENDDRFNALFWLNESSNQVVLSRDPPWTGGTRDEFTDADSCELTAWLQHPNHYRMSVGDDTALKAVVTVARRYRRHPIREYLSGLKWDGTPRVERMLIDLMGVEDRLYNRQAALCFMVGAVARILWFDPKQPYAGAKVDFMLVLEDKQGRKKTTAFETLFGVNWFVETMESPQHNDFYQILQGCWGVEIAEMHAFGKADVARVKGAITRRMDKYRAPYERAPRNWRRECIFVGTTNESVWLRDPTGGRRFLPVRLSGDRDVDIPGLLASRDQLWAEAVHLFEDGFKFWVLPDEAEEEQEQRYMEDCWEGRIVRWLRGGVVAKSDKDPNPYPRRLGFGGTRIDWVTTDELLTYAVGLEPGKHDRNAQMRIAEIMGSRLKWLQRRRVWADTDGDRERRWFRDIATLNAEIASAKGYECPEPSASGVKREGDDDCPF